MRRLLLVIPWLVATAPVVADGKFYVSIDPALPDADEPFQRAAIWYQDGKELLVVQPQFRGTADEFGWIVPVPSVPAVGVVDENDADALFWDLAAAATPRRSIWDRWAGPLLAVMAWLALTLALLMRRRSWRDRLIVILGSFLSLFVVLGFLIPFTTVMHRASSGDTGGVDVLSSERLGLYDTQVIRADAVDEVLARLRERGFAFDDSDRDAFASYIAQGWCFVCSRIAAKSAASDAENDLESSYEEGELLPPLALLFESSACVYPYALTATSGDAVEVHVWVLRPDEVRSKELERRHAGESSVGDDWLSHLLALESRTDDELDDETEPMVTWGSVLPDAPQPDPALFAAASYLHRFRGLLGPQDASGDLIFAPPPDDASSRRRD